MKGEAGQLSIPTPSSGAQSIDPWTLHMRRGEFEEAWRISDWILSRRAGAPCWHLPRHEQYVWDGRSLAGKRVLVRCYHGLGDTVHFIRYCALLKEVAREVIVWAQPELVPLLVSARGIDRILALHDGVPEVEFDADIELMELPHYFRTTLSTLPRRIPYLEPPGGPLFGRASGGDCSLQVGLVWRAGDWDDRRSIPTSALKPLTGINGIRLCALQHGPALAEWPIEWGAVGTRENLVELARVLCGLDLLVSVDTFPAHLAGALGVPTWTLLHTHPDWRWMDVRSDSPWYPTMRLWRQKRQGEWAPVLHAIGAALAQMAGARQMSSEAVPET